MVAERVEPAVWHVFKLFYLLKKGPHGTAVIALAALSCALPVLLLAGDVSGFPTLAMALSFALVGAMLTVIMAVLSRLRGRLDGRRVVPYFSRAQIESGAAPVAGKEIAWVEDAVELFFLQIQGSGRIKLDSGETIRLGYADQNGHPYRSLGRLLIDRGELPLEKTSMQGIKAWAKQHPEKLQEALNTNSSYVFFREMRADLPGPLGALGVPLTARRSIAVDARFIPLGAPVFLATTFPNSLQSLNSLMFAQDTGGAIRGAVRADFFWGFGDEAGALAGRMRQSGKMWVLLPNDYPLPNGN